jgi:hypothetical protein
MNQPYRLLVLTPVLWLLAACNVRTAPAAATLTPTPVPPTATALPALPVMSVLSITPGLAEVGQHISLTSGGDVDTEIVSGARRTGNGRVLSATDGNTVQDSYMQFAVDDSVLFAGWPTPSLSIDIEYLDTGTDIFSLQYDAAGGGPYGNGTFTETRPVVKTDSGKFRTASFVLKDIYFGNRDNGADFRIADNTDGAETIRKVQITILPVPTVINVDACGADPFDDQPDSDAIQACINQARNGDTVTFTSGENLPGYRGYLIEKTIFLEEVAARAYLTFTSSDPGNPALLEAAPGLKGFVVRLFARTRISDAGRIDYITLSHLHLDGNRAQRTCLGPDGVYNGAGDSWGSYLPECTQAGDPWCAPGTLAMDGALDWTDASQNYPLHPDQWSTGHLIEDLLITNTECGTALGMGGAGTVIMDTTVETAGDHVHAAGCTQTDDTEGIGDWSDGITFVGPGHQILNNTVVDPSDVGIVFFGGRATVIRGNTIRVTAGNHGAFAGIAIHPWSLGDVSFGQITSNTVTSEGDETCGNLHVGINIGPHMWGGACLNSVVTPSIGNPSCSLEPVPPAGALCPTSGPCQLWASVASGATYLLTDNNVTGAHINYLVEGLDQVGTLIDTGNVSSAPRRSDWGAARTGCNGVFWGPVDRVAHHPSLAGWTDLRIHCER